MATTLHDSTAFNRSESAAVSVTSGYFSSLYYDPRSFTAVDSTCQEHGGLVLPIDESLASRIVDAADAVSSLHEDAGGSTVSLVEGDMAGKKLFAVSIYPTRSVELKSPPSAWQIFAFILDNLSLLRMPDHAVGTWPDKDRGVHVLDVVVCVEDRWMAAELGVHFNERSMYDLAARKEISLVRPLQALGPVNGEARDA
ncbi:MAG TPA: hypothetical protein VIJ38_05905 [Acidobacteriaceae bacterium]